MNAVLLAQLAALHEREANASIDSRHGPREHQQPPPSFADRGHLLGVAAELAARAEERGFDYGAESGEEQDPWAGCPACLADRSFFAECASCFYDRIEQTTSDRYACAAGDGY